MMTSAEIARDRAILASCYPIDGYDGTDLATVLPRWSAALAEIERLQAEREKAIASVDGIDLREGHVRDNADPDQLRAMLHGAGLTIARLRAFESDARLVAGLRINLNSVLSRAEDLRVDNARLHRDVAALLAAIRQHRDERGDDRCHADDGRLYTVLPEGDTRPARETAVTLENCARYIECRQTGREYLSPQRRIEELEADNTRLRADLQGMAYRLASASEALGQVAERGCAKCREWPEQPNAPKEFCLGLSQQCWHMATAAAEAIGQTFGETSPSDITEYMANLRIRMGKVTAENARLQSAALSQAAERQSASAVREELRAAGADGWDTIADPAAHLGRGESWPPAIPCAERMPEVGKIVLFWDILHQDWEQGDWMGHCWRRRSGHSREANRVRFWLPLPPAPEQP